MHTPNTKHYIISAASLLLIALGIAMITRANMGTVAIICPAYVISSMPGQPLTWGTLVVLTQLLFVAVECILQKSVKGIDIVPQLVTSVVFGLMLDFSMWAMMYMQWDSTASGIAIRIAQVVAGSAIAGAGFSIHLRSNVLLSADGLAMSFAKALGCGFVVARVCCDVAMMTVALIFCVFYFGGIRWNMIGAGTAISMASVWLVFAYMQRRGPGRLSAFLHDGADAASFADASAAQGMQQDSFPLVITIARTHGSGGHEIGMKVSERLGIKFYDKELIQATAQKTGMTADKISDLEQRYSLRHASRDGEIFEAQSQIIRDASRESCVIIGRCADYVLRNRPYCLNIFARCDEDYAVTMIRNKDNLSEEQAREVIRLKNNTREKHYNHYTGRKWQDPDHYDLVINTAKIGIESAVDIVCNAVENVMKEEK